jgi:Arc/MetJ family transcription regulator
MCNPAKDSHAANMRTNMDIDNELREQAMRLKGLATKKATIEEASCTHPAPGTAQSHGRTVAAVTACCITIF